MLVPPRRPASGPAADAVERLRATPPDRRLALLTPRLHLFPSLHHLLPLDAILPVLRETGAAGRRSRRLPAHAAVWRVIGQALCAGRGIPMAWRHLHPSADAP